MQSASVNFPSLRSSAQDAAILYNIDLKQCILQEQLMKSVFNDAADLGQLEVEIKKSHLELYRAILAGIDKAYDMPETTSLAVFNTSCAGLKRAPLKKYLDDRTAAFVGTWLDKICKRTLSYQRPANPERAFEFLDGSRIELVREIKSQRNNLARLVDNNGLVEDQPFMFDFVMNQARLVKAAFESVVYALTISPLEDQPDSYGSCIQEEMVLLTVMSIDVASTHSSLIYNRKQYERDLIDRMRIIALQLFLKFEGKAVKSLSEAEKEYYEQLKKEGINRVISYKKQANVYCEVLVARVLQVTVAVNQGIQELEDILNLVPYLVAEEKRLVAVGNVTKETIDLALVRVHSAYKRYEELHQLYEQRNNNNNVIETTVEDSGLGDSVAIESEDLDTSTATDLELNDSIRTAIESEDLDSSTATALELNDSVMTAIESEDLDYSTATALELNDSVMTAIESEDLDSSTATALELNDSVMTAIESEDLDSATATALELNDSVMRAIESEDLDSSTATALELNDSVMTAIESEDLDFSTTTALELNDSVMTAIESEDETRDILNESTATAVEYNLNESTMTAIETEEDMANALNESTETAVEYDLNESTMTAIEQEEIADCRTTQLTERKTASINPTTPSPESITTQEITETKPDAEMSRMDQLVVALFLAYIALLIIHFTLEQ